MKLALAKSLKFWFTKDQGVKLVGPLPKEIENVTTYCGGTIGQCKHAGTSREIHPVLTTLYAKETFSSTGVE